MARWARDQARRSIYIRSRGVEAAPPAPFGPRPGLRGGRASGPRPPPSPEPSGRTVAGPGLPGVMGRAGEPGLRGRNGGQLRGPLGRSPGADRPPAPRGAQPSGLWPPGLPPPVPWPLAGPRRRPPYLRSPGPPFYFLKPSHKAPRRPGLVCLLPETPARAHLPSRLRAKRAVSGCARSPARRSSRDLGPSRAKLGARACALTAPASFSRRPRGRGQGRAHA